MEAVKAITVCVDFADYLAVTLPANADRFERVLIVTAPGDEQAAKVARSLPNVSVHVTDAFFRDGAALNKGAAIEEGFEVLGRSGWICHIDADILLPGRPDLFHRLEPGCIHLCRRRICRSPWSGGLDEPWDAWPLCGDAPWVAGFLQVFHADDPALGSRPWYPTDWLHAGGSDTEFILRWPVSHRRCFDWEVLHLGEPGRNWWGRVEPYRDGSEPEMAADRRRRMEKMHADRRRHGYKFERAGRPGWELRWRR